MEHMRDLAELERLAERFHALYRDNPRKRCVHAAAELFEWLADRGWDVTAVKRNVRVTGADLGIVRNGTLVEHAWVEVEVPGEGTYVVDVTLPQQFRVNRLVWSKDEYLAGGDGRQVRTTYAETPQKGGGDAHVHQETTGVREE